MDWSGEWWVLILGPGLVILVVGILYFTRSRAFRFVPQPPQLGLIALQGLNPITEQDKNKSNLFCKGGAGKITNLFGDRVKNPSRLLFDFSDSVGSAAGTNCTQTVAAFAAPDSVQDFQLIPSELGECRAAGTRPSEHSSRLRFRPAIFAARRK